MPRISLSSLSLCLLIPLLVLLMTDGFGIVSLISSLNPRQEFFFGALVLLKYAFLAFIYASSVLLTMYLVKVFQLASLQSHLWSSVCAGVSGAALTYALVVMNERLFIAIALLLVGIGMNFDIHSPFKNRSFFNPTSKEQALVSQKHYVIILLALAFFGWVLATIYQDIADYRGTYDDISYDLSMSEADIAAMDQRFFAIKYSSLDQDNYDRIDKEGLTEKIQSGETKYGKIEFYALGSNDRILARCRYQGDEFYANSFSLFKRNSISAQRICVIRKSEFLDLL